MEWNAVANFIKPELLAIVAVCWVVGYILKQTPRVPDWTIIYGVTLAAIILVSLTLGFTAESFLQGILCGAVAVYGNQLVKQVQKSGDE
ncbi:PPE-repeat protein [Paenibacillus sp. IHB B 3415]|uniref:phage holin family protein n=1 Tax=Paenibacillus sp. IHB B 3415 TaxID=867080 RepID=UPI000575CC5D|nr:phage holin family protein [Paenibacillus sp. IHB B 3415]KHL97371.1 PPE-repeat protein [Paenibacillus sp. IHB B 3415]